MSKTTGDTPPAAAPKKILFTASTMSHIENFHMPYLKAFEEMGWEVKVLVLPVSKSFFSLQNIRAIFSTRKQLLAEGYDIISSQSTLAGIVTRLSVILTGKARKRMKIFHTAHGYLFHDDNSLKKWAYLLPEILCGKVTDVLMVMNHEDLEIARKYRLCGKNDKIYYINGMGIDLSKFEAVKNAPPSTINEWKRSFGLEENDFTFVYAAEFSKRKNHQLLLRGFAMAIQKLKELENSGELPAELSADRLKLVLAGDGILLEDMKVLASELDVAGQVLFPGYVRNIPELYVCCQAAVSTSLIEGLPFNIMEAMACGLPVIASDIKGHKELIEHGENGMLFESGNTDILTEQITSTFLNNNIMEEFKTFSSQKIKCFSLDRVFSSIMDTYKSIT